MEPIYLDLHIHTSDDPNSLNENFDLENLISGVKIVAQGNNYLISFTDHNTINQKVYEQALKIIPKNLILGVELHVRASNNPKSKVYHCHIYFNFDESSIDIDAIKKINKILDSLYQNKSPSLNDNIPSVEGILNAFDEYDFLLLPHGGQTHSTFDQALPNGKEFDNAMQRSIYYNFFDGFTSRSEKKTETTRDYLKKLGVYDFVNLITCTDNYNPNIYPKPKNNETYEFVPTWMFASQSFSGLRLSLSDSSRLEYSKEKPKKWRESIKGIKLQNEHIDIDVRLTPGLNVIIGESSSGKTLLVDSIEKKLTNSDFSGSVYKKFGVENIEINYPDNLRPHFIPQNFIAKVTADGRKVNEIEIIAKLFPDNTSASKKISKGLGDLSNALDQLFSVVENIEKLKSEIERHPVLSGLIITEDVNENILKAFFDIVNSTGHPNYSEVDKILDFENLNDIGNKLAENPFINHDKNLVKDLKRELQEMRNFSKIENEIKTIIGDKKNNIDQALQKREGEAQRKKQDFDSLVKKMKKYYELIIKFEKIITAVAKYSINAESEKVQIDGYVLSVENSFRLNKDILKDELNNLLYKEKNILNFDDICPEDLFRSNFKNNTKGVLKTGSATYKSIKDNIYAKFFENDNVAYKIMTPDGRNFDNLSPGLKASIILDLILNFKDDHAPLIIDQPEDNLATSYMNDGLVKSIKKMKTDKQIIFVSHSATIPMSGDAQNIILCENINGKIVIRSNALEGKVNNVQVLDYIAKIADGGKSSIKKRFKKYNLKKFNE